MKDNALTKKEMVIDTITESEICECFTKIAWALKELHQNPGGGWWNNEREKMSDEVIFHTGVKMNNGRLSVMKYGDDRELIE